MKATLLLAFAALASSAGVAGPFDQPWAAVDTGAMSEVRKEDPVAITKIDGVDTLHPDRSGPLAPGKHTIRVHYETAFGVVADKVRELDLELKPCTRYRIVAQYRTRTRPDWKPKIYRERIGECRAKFGKDPGKVTPA